VKWKSETHSNYSGVGEGEIKENDGEGEINCDIL
jgi:hypothetical protein